MSIYNILVAENLLRIDELFKFLNYYHSMKKNESYCYKLSNRHISRYIFNCKKRSVLEPSLSAMYQLQITDDEVCRDTGYIFRIKFLLKIIQYNGNSSLSCC